MLVLELWITVSVGIRVRVTVRDTLDTKSLGTKRSRYEMSGLKAHFYGTQCISVNSTAHCASFVYLAAYSPVLNLVVCN